MCIMLQNNMQVGINSKMIPGRININYNVHIHKIIACTAQLLSPRSNVLNSLFIYQFNATVLSVEKLSYHVHKHLWLHILGFISSVWWTNLNTLTLGKYTLTIKIKRTYFPKVESTTNSPPPQFWKSRGVLKIMGGGGGTLVRLGWP